MTHILFNFSNIEKITWIDRKEIKMIKVSSNKYCTVHLHSGEIIKVTTQEVKKLMGSDRAKPEAVTLKLSIIKIIPTLLKTPSKELNTP